jgi:hypothetical protein
MKHPQCDQEGDQSRTNDVISIQTTHGSILSCCGRQRKRGSIKTLRVEVAARFSLSVTT